MSTEALCALLPFAVVASITPGANNLLVLSCAINHGLKATFPYQFCAGLACMLIIALFLLLVNSLAEFLPQILPIIKYLGLSSLLSG